MAHFCARKLNHHVMNKNTMNSYTLLLLISISLFVVAVVDVTNHTIVDVNINVVVVKVNYVNNCNNTFTHRIFSERVDAYKSKMYVTRVEEGDAGLYTCEVQTTDGLMLMASNNLFIYGTFIRSLFPKEFVILLFNFIYFIHVL